MWVIYEDIADDQGKLHTTHTERHIISLGDNNSEIRSESINLTMMKRLPKNNIPDFCLD